MTVIRPRTARSVAGALVALASLSGCASMGRGGAVERTAEEEAAIHRPLSEIPTRPEEFLRQARGTYVVIDLDVNRLRLMDGAQTLWEAPVGTGTGLRLKGEDGEWHFSTPRGVFRIQYKEELPVWYLPDWYFIEKGEPVPPQESPKRKAPGQLGVAAVYLGQEIAIHGTDKPELLGQRVSHGCIRLANTFVQRLYHNVQVGTPVVIVGGEKLADTPPPPTPAPGKPRPPAPDPLRGVSTAQLLARLDAEFAKANPTPAWIPLASRLITRGHKEDVVALRGLLERAGRPKSPALRREFATFLADTYARGSLRTVVALARIEPRARAAAAQSIVDAMLSLHPLPSTDPAAPWPTRRVPPERLGPEGKAGWAALREAEEAYRTRPAYTSGPVER